MKRKNLLIAALMMVFTLLTFSNANATPEPVPSNLPIDSHGWVLIIAALAIGCAAIIFKMKQESAQSKN